jgi:hypothetical protein
LYFPTEKAVAVYEALIAVDDGQSDLEVDMKERARAAGAATLLVKAPVWLKQNPAAEQHACAILGASMAGISESVEPQKRHFSLKQSSLEYVAHYVVLDWIATASPATDEAVMRVLTSGDDRAVQVVVHHAYQNRAILGPRWWRLLQMGLWWAGLSILTPRYGDDELAQPRWRRWVAWLRKRRLSGVSAGPGDIDPLNIAQRVERFERSRWEQRYAKEGWGQKIRPGQRCTGGLDTHFLQGMFNWLLDENRAPSNAAERSEWTSLVRRFWAHEAWCRTGSADEDNKDYKPLSQMLGYKVVSAVARLTLTAAESEAAELWQSVLALGPRGFYALGSFLSDWFALITESTDVAAFAVRWRAMVEYMLTQSDWTMGHGDQLQRQALGFGADSFIVRAPGHATLIGSMRDLYKAWAERELAGDEDNLAGLCGFLCTEAGRALRLDGLTWISEALKREASAGRWYRDRTRNAFVEFLDVLVTEHSDEIGKDVKSRQALIELVAHAVVRQIPAALTLQERVRKRF